MDRSRTRLSKYVLSNIVFFLPLRNQLALRLVSRTHDAAVQIGLNCLFFELQLHVDQCNYLLETAFDKKTQEEHYKLAS